jgi:hypothetical protein
VSVVLISRSINLLEPSGSVKACNGIALPLPLPLYIYIQSFGSQMYFGLEEKSRTAKQVLLDPLGLEGANLELRNRQCNVFATANVT